MRNITDIVDSYDNKYFETLNEKSKEILDELERTFGVNFREIPWAKGYSNYDLFRTVRLICLDNGTIDTFLRIAGEKGYIGKDIISAIISLYTSDRSNFEIMKNRAIENGVIDSWERDKNGFINVKSKMCDEVIFKKLTDATSNKDIHQFVKRANSHSLCHESAEVLLKKIEDSKAVTSFCNPKFQGNKMLHSFLVTNDNFVIDVNTNLVMPKYIYYKFYDVDEISVVKRDELDDLDEKAKKYDMEDSDLYPLIRIAMYKKYFEKEDLDKRNLNSYNIDI